MNTPTYRFHECWFRRRRYSKARYGDRRATSARSVYEGCSGGGRRDLIQASRSTAIAVASPPPMQACHPAGHSALTHRSEQRDEDACTGRTDGMPERTGCAVDVDALVGQRQLLHGGLSGLHPVSRRSRAAFVLRSRMIMPAMWPPKHELAWTAEQLVARYAPRLPPRASRLLA